MTTLEAPAETPTATLPAEADVVIVGAGFAGLGMAIKLQQAGFEDYVVLERGAKVGGTWHFNSYPGCGCDVPSHLYSFSFAPNPGWTQTYSKQPEIEAYLQRVARDFGTEQRTFTETTVEGASWDDDAQRWTVETSRGAIHGRVLVSAAGPLSDPRVPDIEGLDSFEGHVMHSAQWDHDYDLRGKRVASIGTGASAIQYVPEIAPEVEQLFVFQRTPPWIMPHSDRPIRPFERRLYRRFPALQKLVRGGIYSARELLVLGFAKQPKLMGPVQKIAVKHRERQISDPELREKVAPDYTIGCKRILPSNKWYPALDRDNVELVTEGIGEVRPHSVVTTDGTEHEVDAIIFGTGFNVTDIPVAKALRGRDGRLLDEHWGGSMHAHLGCTIPGFPNLFLLLGPNTGLGHSSMVYVIESQIAYVLDALRTMRDRGAEVAEVKPEAEQAFNAELDRRMQGTVWNTGCSSWYLDDTGRNATLWPDWTWVFRRKTARLDPSEYELRTARPAPATASP
jgi:cation diffusion facilitator CzcD-associated flavoprotein CzcO